MPSPRKNETQDKFVGRCISYVKKEHPEWGKDQVVAVCYSIWRKAKGETPEKSSNLEYKKTKAVIEAQDGEETEKFRFAVGTRDS